jgi:DNA repair protein RadD
MKEFEDRWYQIEAEDALLSDLLNDDECHPIAAVPTGAGKTKILGALIYKYLEIKPEHSILVLSHTENILKQDFEAIESFFPGIYIGLYSSGLGSRTIEKITVAGIQSIYHKSHLFKDFDVAIIDEAHSVPTKGSGMYRKFFASTNLRRVGLTATHFRTGHGYVHKGKGALFNKLSYDLSSMENFNRLVDEGYLTKLFSKPTELQLDTEGVKESAGDFNIKDLAKHFDRTSITNAAIEELLKFSKNYKSWLIFAIDIDHADHINEKLQSYGIKSKVLHSRSEEERHEVTDEFVRGRIQCLVSVGMVTTGFDAPNIDLVVLLRPTKSPVLHIQMIGRGSRVSPETGKTHCLVLDFAGNISRLGPVNAVTIPVKGKKKGTGEPIVKKCKYCGCLHHPTVKFCNVCGTEFEFKEKIKTIYDQVDVVKTQSVKIEEWLRVDEVFYSIHSKVGKPDSMKVIYKCGLLSYNEFICLDHGGYATVKARNWVQFRLNFMPKNVYELYKNSSKLITPTKILVNTTDRYPVIKNVKF